APTDSPTIKTSRSAAPGGMGEIGRQSATGSLRSSRRRQRIGVAGTRAPATPTSLLTAADPGLGAQDRALLVRLERPQGTGGVVERHLLTAGRGVRRPVLPVEPGAGARSVVVALLQRWLRTVDRPEGCDRCAGGVLETLEVTGSRCTLELGIRARMGTGDIRV